MTNMRGWPATWPAMLAKACPTGPLTLPIITSGMASVYCPSAARTVASPVASQICSVIVVPLALIEGSIASRAVTWKPAILRLSGVAGASAARHDRRRAPSTCTHREGNPVTDNPTRSSLRLCVAIVAAASLGAATSAHAGCPRARSQNSDVATTITFVRSFGRISRHLLEGLLRKRQELWRS